MIYGLGSENCRYIFTNDFFLMKNINSRDSNKNNLNKIKNYNDVLSLVLNILCFKNMDQAISFNSIFSKNYNIFLGSIHAKNILFYNKNQINNLRILYKTLLANHNFMTNVGQNEIFSIEKNNLISLQKRNSNDYIDNSNINYTFLNFGNDGIILSEETGNKIENIQFSFSYNNIRDCNVHFIPKEFVLPKQILISQSNKCCIKMIIDMKDVYDSVLYLCSFKSSLYQCNLEAKFMQEALKFKCTNKFNMNIEHAFDNDINMNVYIKGN
jgi:hypothetical protein